MTSRGGAAAAAGSKLKQPAEETELADTRDSTNDAALEILKRLEPAIAGLATRLTAIEGRLTSVETRLGAVEISVANLQGRVSQLPTSWLMLTAIVTTVIAVTGGTAAILFAALNYARAS